MTHNVFNFEVNAATPPSHLFKFLTVDGLDVDPDMMVDGSSTPVNFDYIATAECVIERANIFIEDGGPGSSILPAFFMALGVKLTNGIRIVALDEAGAEVRDYLDGTTIKSHKQFGLLSGIDSVSNLGNALTADVALIRWTLGHTGAALRLSPGEKFRFIIQDDLTDLEDMRVFLQGYFI